VRGRRLHAPRVRGQITKRFQVRTMASPRFTVSFSDELRRPPPFSPPSPHRHPYARSSLIGQRLGVGVARMRQGACVSSHHITGMFSSSSSVTSKSFFSPVCERVGALYTSHPTYNRMVMRRLQVIAESDTDWGCFRGCGISSSHGRPRDFFPAVGANSRMQKS